MTVVELAQRRPPVWYTIDVGHHWDDRLEIVVKDVSDDDRSRASVDDAIARIAESRMTAGHIHRAMLNRIDALMGAEAGTPECEELRRLANACQAFEESK